MRILVLGATGRTGKWVVNKALNKGYEVAAVVRDKNKIIHQKNLEVFEGDVRDSVVLSLAAAKCTAIINVLNISRSTDFPWAPLRSPKTLVSETLKSCLQVATVLGIERIIICSAWGVGETKGDIPFWFRWIIQYSNIGVAYKDHERQEHLLRASNLKWTIVRPVGLTNSLKEEKIQLSYGNKPLPKLMISRKSVAKFIVDALENDALVGMLPVISRK